MDGAMVSKGQRALFLGDQLCFLNTLQVNQVSGTLRCLRCTGSVLCGCLLPCRKAPAGHCLVRVVTHVTGRGSVRGSMSRQGTVCRQQVKYAPMTACN